MARITSVTFETTTQGRPGAFTIPRPAANLLGLGADDPVELRVTWEGGRLELTTDLRSGWEVYPRSSDATTSGLETIPARTPITVTVWRTGDAESDEPAEPDSQKGWWGLDDGADFESRLPADDVAVRRLLDWARALAADDLVRLYSYHSADGSAFTLLPYLKQHEAGLVTIWGTGRLTLFRSVFAQFAPESMGRIEELLGKPMSPKPNVAVPDEAMLFSLREAYVAAADVPAGTDWTDERFDATFAKAVGSRDLLDALRQWALDRGISVRYGAGKASGPLHFNLEGGQGQVSLVDIGATGGIEWVFRNNLDQAGGLADRDARVSLVRKVRDLFGVDRPDERADTWFGVNASTLDASDHAQFLSLLDDELKLAQQGLPKRRSSELSRHYQRLLEKVLARFKELRPGITSITHAGPQNWLPFSAGRPGLSFVWSTAVRKYFRVELYIDVGNQIENKALFDALRSQQGDLEGAVGEQISWERLDTKQASRLAVYYPKGDEDVDNDAELVQWAAETMSRFIDALRPAIRKL